jgi:AraC-like DNA-binding protein
MIGSRLLGQQPTFRGADFAMPEVALFGYYEFRSAVATSDSWERHDGVEILFMRSGEACWELTDDDRFMVVNGGQAVLFPSGTRHRIANGVYSPCRLFWMVFDAKEAASANARLFPSGEIEALFDLAMFQNAPIVLPETCVRDLNDLCSQLTDERLLIGSALIMADVRSKIYASVIEMWKTGANGDDHARSKLVRQAIRLLRESADGTADEDHDERIADIAHHLGYGKSRLYDLFGREVGMAPNDYRQRVRIKRCCERLVQTDETVTSIGFSSGFGSSQYFARVFKKYVGITPTAYRQLFGRGSGRVQEARG